MDGARPAWRQEVEEILTRIVHSKDGIRRADGVIVSPPGWVMLTASDTDEVAYVQTSRIGWVRED